MLKLKSSLAQGRDFQVNVYPEWPGHVLKQSPGMQEGSAGMVEAGPQVLRRALTCGPLSYLHVHGYFYGFHLELLEDTQGGT